MTETRFRGEIAGQKGDPITVFTDWMDEPDGVLQGVEIGLELRGWENIERQERGDGDD